MQDNVANFEEMADHRSWIFFAITCKMKIERNYVRLVVARDKDDRGSHYFLTAPSPHQNILSINLTESYFLSGNENSLCVKDKPMKNFRPTTQILVKYFLEL